jgi:hypothetical protein
MKTFRILATSTAGAFPGISICRILTATSREAARKKAIEIWEAQWGVGAAKTLSISVKEIGSNPPVGSGS